MGHVVEAIAACEEALRLDPGSEDARANLLEARADPASKDDVPESVIIHTFSFPSEAEIALGRLRAEGIPAAVVREEVAAMRWLFSNMVGGARLCVCNDDAGDALAVLDCGELPTRKCCHHCGSGNSSYARYNVSLVYLAILLLSFPLPLKENLWTCHECGAKWRDQSGP